MQYEMKVHTPSSKFLNFVLYFVRNLRELNVKKIFVEIDFQDSEVYITLTLNFWLVKPVFLHNRQATLSCPNLRFNMKIHAHSPLGIFMITFQFSDLVFKAGINLALGMKKIMNIYVIFATVIKLDSQCLIVNDWINTRIWRRLKMFLFESKFSRKQKFYVHIDHLL